MVQPTNKSVIGSNLREDSIKKRDFTDLTIIVQRTEALLRRPSSFVPWLGLDSLGVYTISLFFFHHSPFFALQRQSVFCSVTEAASRQQPTTANFLSSFSK